MSQNQMILINGKSSTKNNKRNSKNEGVVTENRDMENDFIEVKYQKQKICKRFKKILAQGHMRTMAIISLDLPGRFGCIYTGSKEQQQKREW